LSKYVKKWGGKHAALSPSAGGKTKNNIRLPNERKTSGVNILLGGG